MDKIFNKKYFAAEISDSIKKSAEKIDSAIRCRNTNTEIVSDNRESYSF